MRKGYKIMLFILGILIIYYFNLFGRAHGLYLNFIITGVINFILTYYLLKLNQFKKVGLFLIFFPFFLLTGTVIFGLVVSQKMPGIISFFMYIVSILFCVALYMSNKKLIISFIYSIILGVSIISYPNIMNYYDSVMDNNNNKIVGNNLPLIKLFDKEKALFELKGNGKIQVIDLWSNSCGNCIQAFPKFEKLKNYFSNNNEVDVFAVNINDGKQDFEQSEFYLKKYTFKNFYADKSIYKKLNFNSIPNYMIIGKDGKIKYFGSLNAETIETYNNIYKLIENEK